jgi:hypothetical protein
MNGFSIPKEPKMSCPINLDKAKDLSVQRRLKTKPVKNRGMIHVRAFNPVQNNNPCVGVERRALSWKRKKATLLQGLKKNRHNQYQTKISREWVSYRDQNSTTENINTKSIKLITNHRWRQDHCWRLAKMEDGGEEQLAWRQAYHLSMCAMHALAREDWMVKRLTVN